MYRNLSGQISVSDVAYMYYNEHRTKKETAAALGISIVTVNRYLGKYRKSLTDGENKVVATVDSTKTFGDRIEEYLAAHQVAEVIPAPQPKLLEMVSRQMSLKGNYCTFAVDNVSGNVELTDGAIQGFLTVNDIDSFIEELTELKVLMKA